ncbi:hypothetical protein Tco_1436486 [Tanacetum coccineum]
MSHAHAPHDSYDSDYDLSEHSVTDTQQQVEREITPEREISSAKTASPPPSPPAITPPAQARQGPHRRQTADQDPYVAAAQPTEPREVWTNTRYVVTSTSVGMHDLSASIESLLSVIEWANDDRHEIQASGRRAGMWVLLAELISQVAGGLNAGKTNAGGNTSNAGNGCSYKTFMANRLKEFFGRGNITSSNPTTLHAAVSIDHRLTAGIIRDGEIAKKGDSGKKRKVDRQKNQGCGQHNKR